MNNPRMFSYKKIIILFIAVVWIIFSAIYIINDQWKDFQTIQVRQAYNAGVSASVRTLIQESAKCAPVPLFNGDQKTEVIAVKCLQQAKEQQQQ